MRIDWIRVSMPPDDDGTPSSAPGADQPGIQPGAAMTWTGAERDRERARAEDGLVRADRPDRPHGTNPAGRTALI